jgi:uncharacterized protein (DUF1501 family)
MDTLSRRHFLKLTAAVGLSAPMLSLEQIAAEAAIRPMQPGTPILVVITLYGGNDGLNTVVPVKDPLYQSLRPGIAYKESEVLPLADDLYLNGAMTGIKSLWDQKKVAIVRGVGYPNSDRSHFSSMAIWQNASPKNEFKTGWIGRFLDTQAYDPMTAINIGSVLPPLMVGKKSVGSALPMGGLKLPNPKIARSCEMVSRPDVSDSKLMALAASSVRNLLNLSTDITPVLAKPAIATPDLPTVDGGNAGGDTALAQQLDIIAKLIAVGAPTKVWAASLGGFDTHANEKGAQSVLLGNVSGAVSKFLAQLKTTKYGKDVTVMIYSEFGRRVVANASQGTDHGTSGPVFIIGDNVQGGFYGDQPSLKNLNQNDLAVTTDFRDIYGTISDKILGIPGEKILSNWKTRSNFLLYK